MAYINSEPKAHNLGRQARREGYFLNEYPPMPEQYIEHWKRGWQLQNKLIEMTNTDSQFLTRHIANYDLGKYKLPPKSKQHSIKIVLSQRNRHLAALICQYLDIDHHKLVNILIEIMDTAIGEKLAGGEIQISPPKTSTTKTVCSSNTYS